MVRTSKFNLSINSIWFCLLVVYLVTGYFAQNALMPASVNSIMLYAFLGYSVFAILCVRKIKFNVLIGWELACLALAIIAMLYSPSFSLLEGTFYAMLVNFFLVFILSQMSWTKERFHLIMKTLVASSAGLILSLALTGNLNDSASGRLGEEMYGNANNLAMMLMVGAI